MYLRLQKISFLSLLFLHGFHYDYYKVFDLCLCKNKSTLRANIEQRLIDFCIFIVFSGFYMSFDAIDAFKGITSSVRAACQLQQKVLKNL